MTRILVEPGYTVPPRYIELDDGEEVCPMCHGKGKIVWKYGRNSNEYAQCPSCSGEGKRVRCSGCGEWMDVLYQRNELIVGRTCEKCFRKALLSVGAVQFLHEEE